MKFAAKENEVLGKVLNFINAKFHRFLNFYFNCFFQILRQYPLSFEFNEYFLHFLAYHHVSMRFRTFLLDSEHERQQMGWLSDDDDDDKKNPKSRGKSLWEYVNELHKNSSLFYNFKYSKEHSNKVSFHPISC